MYFSSESNAFSTLIRIIYLFIYCYNNNNTIYFTFLKLVTGSLTRGIKAIPCYIILPVWSPTHGA